MGRKFRSRHSIRRNQHHTGRALEKRIVRRRNRLGRMALPRSDARVWLRAASDQAVASLLHETDSWGATEGILQVTGVFVERSIQGLTSSAVEPRTMGPSSSEHLQVRDYNLIDQSFRIQFSSDAQQ